MAAAEQIARELRVSRTVAAILVRRGHDTPELARGFLTAGDCHDPLLLRDMAVARDLVLDHVRRGSPIVVHGDYDVDGVCATALLVRTLRALGAAVSWHLPSRFEEGYGLAVSTVQRLADAGAGLLLTVDCGITATAEVEHARARGLDVVVTDHHVPGEVLPDCPVVHPALGGYPFPHLCGTGVALKLAQALRGAGSGGPDEPGEDLELAALATVADLVPLVGENRGLAREGLAALRRTRSPGLLALMAVASLEPAAVSAGTVGFRLAPRINAAGRLGRADAALELLLTDDGARAASVASELDGLNRERRDTETRILFAAEAARSEHAHLPAYVLAGEGWHPGVIGIVASRLVERHHRPCVLIALDGESGRGSGRSIGAYDLLAGLTACAAHLRRFGGHRMAAGLEIDAGAVDGFRRDLARHAAGALSPHDLTRCERVDALVSGTALGLDLAAELGRLGPFGQGNPEPTLLLPAATIGHVTAMGDEGQHARFTLTSGGARARGVAFRASPGALAGSGAEPRDVAVRLEANEWNGTVEPRLVLRAVCQEGEGICELVGDDAPFWEALERELAADPARWPGALGGPESRTEGAGTAAPAPSLPARTGHAASRRRLLLDRRGEGFAGVAGDLLSSGERVLIVCASVPRRREGVERVLGGIGPEDAAACRLGLVSWPALARGPAGALDFDHLIALDPPPLEAGVALLEGAPAARSGFAHLAWGPAEAELALAVAASELDLRPRLVELYRALRDAGGARRGALESLLRAAGGAGQGGGELCGRLLRVLTELELVAFSAGSEPECRLLEARRTDLERSAAYRGYRDRLEEARAYLEAERAGRAYIDAARTTHASPPIRAAS